MTEQKIDVYDKMVALNNKLIDKDFSKLDWKEKMALTKEADEVLQDMEDLTNNFSFKCFDIKRCPDVFVRFLFGIFANFEDYIKAAYSPYADARWENSLRIANAINDVDVSVYNDFSAEHVLYKGILNVHRTLIQTIVRGIVNELLSNRDLVCDGYQYYIDLLDGKKQPLPFI